MDNRERTSGVRADKSPAKLTSLFIDGNSISVVATELDGDRVHVRGAVHREYPEVLELVKRLRHPVFMNLNICWYPDKEIIIRELRTLLEPEVFRNPVVCVLPSEKLQSYELEGPSDKASISARREELLAANLPANPFGYPCVITFHELPGRNGGGKTILTVSSLSDIVPLMEIVKAVGLPLRGIVPAQSASAQLLLSLNLPDEDEPISLCHIGKLRTIYTNRLPDGTLHHHPIPVGLLRDDMYYFESLPKTLIGVEEVLDRYGDLFLPPEVTPVMSPSKEWLSTPQNDGTRFARQIARYAKRAFTQTGEIPDPGGDHLLCGRAGRIPGLAAYISDQIGVAVHLPTPESFPAIEVPDHLDWTEVCDDLIAVGGAMEAFWTERTPLALLGGDFRSLGTVRRKRPVANLEDDQLYVLEQRP